MKIELLGGYTKEELESRVRRIASAGKLSRFPGNVFEVVQSCNDTEKNIKLIKRIIGMGHKSIIEHDYLVFALCDVTPIVEQTIIGYRLTSFTIKSRREVDFRNVGFYVPDFKTVKGDRLDSRELKLDYNNYMKSLFTKYGELVDEGLPIEDCRYILPYSYHSNIVMGCDANELFRITSDLLYGKMAKIDEAKELGAKLANMMGEACPYLVSSLKKEENKKTNINIVKDMYEYVKEMKEDKFLKITVCDDNKTVFNYIMKKLKKINGIEVLDVSHMSRKVIRQGTEDIPIEYYYTEISLSNVDKWDAIKFLITKLEIKPEEVIAIGDNINDKKMIENAGLGVVMQGSTPVVTEVADYITDSNNDEGVAKILQKYYKNINF